ncbi:TetR/AcrR family transcriptional regulator [Allosphingosinicella indica]|uniref:Transcriptional regulator, TetR family n=1 Tax=Allosphingosinicella indica TaxID=941907 RepID=A0A1X7GI64_9SPHN|nr:TetR/AcrR family transcriptional regulator [Allosphingosinicella indica]SMF69420.1 transcriptional regulator, TetR family [Allosphingosinicella indica]
MTKEGAERPQTYSSPAIRARRDRILDETRKMIAEGGVDALSMNEIGRRAGVAKRTLYNAFQTRERMIAAAIEEYFDDYVARIPFRAAPGTLMYNLERIISFNQHNLKIRNYVRAIMASYFSGGADSDIASTMHTVAMRANRTWLKTVEAEGDLQPWIDLDDLVGDIVRFEFATLSDWANYRLTSDALVPRSVMGYLALAAGATRGAARAEIEAMLKSVGEEGVPALPRPGRMRAAA